MGRFLIFSDNRPVWAAARLALTACGFDVTLVDIPAEFAGGQFSLVVVEELRNAAAEDVVVLLGGTASCRVGSLCAFTTRLRCQEYSFSGQIAISVVPSERIPVETEWLNSVGVTVVPIWQFVSGLVRLLIGPAPISKRSNCLLPSVACRPLWAVNLELPEVMHRVRNKLNKLGGLRPGDPSLPGLCQELKSWAVEIENILQSRQV